MRTLNFSDARSNLKQVLDQVVEDADVTIITRRDAEDVVVMSLATWNGWQETQYLLSSPANAKRLLASIAALQTGKGVARELIEPGHAEVREPRPSYRTGKSRAKTSQGRSRSKRG